MRGAAAAAGAVVVAHLQSECQRLPCATSEAREAMEGAGLRSQALPRQVMRPLCLPRNYCWRRRRADPLQHRRLPWLLLLLLLWRLPALSHSLPGGGEWRGCQAQHQACGLQHCQGWVGEAIIDLPMNHRSHASHRLACSKGRGGGRRQTMLCLGALLRQRCGAWRLPGGAFSVSGVSAMHSYLPCISRNARQLGNHSNISLHSTAFTRKTTTT